MNKFLVSALLIITFTIGLGAGYTLTPEYASMSDKEETMVPLGAADRYVDLRYINGLISHHLTAIDLARQALRESHREEIRSLAEEIIASDERGIAELMTWKQSWFKDDRKISKFDAVNLGTNDNKFDLRFLNALIYHHETAIMTASEISTKSSRNEVLNLADTIKVSLSSGMRSLEQWRADWYGI